MRIHDTVEETMSQKAKEAINAGLFPGARTEQVFPVHSESYFATNIFLGNGEEYVSPVDGRTTLVGKFKWSVHRISGTGLRHTHLKLKGE